MDYRKFYVNIPIHVSREYWNFNRYKIFLKRESHSFNTYLDVCIEIFDTNHNTLKSIPLNDINTVIENFNSETSTNSLWDKLTIFDNRSFQEYLEKKNNLCPYINVEQNDPIVSSPPMTKKYPMPERRRYNFKKSKGKKDFASIHKTTTLSIPPTNEQHLDLDSILLTNYLHNEI